MSDGDEQSEQSEEFRRGWESGFSSGGSDISADWEMALGDLMPEVASVSPVNVAAWINGLEQEIVLLRSAVRQMFEAQARAGAPTVMLSGTEAEIGEMREAVDRALKAHPDDTPAPEHHTIVVTDVEHAVYVLAHPASCLAAQLEGCMFTDWAVAAWLDDKTVADEGVWVGVPDGEGNFDMLRAVQ